MNWTTLVDIGDFFRGEQVGEDLLGFTYGLLAATAISIVAVVTLIVIVYCLVVKIKKLKRQLRLKEPKDEEERTEERTEESTEERAESKPAEEIPLVDVAPESKSEEIDDTYDSLLTPSTKKPEETPKDSAMDELPGYDVIGNEETTKDSKTSSKKFSFSFHGSQRRKSKVEKREDNKGGGKEGEVKMEQQVNYALITKSSKKDKAPSKEDTYHTLQHCTDLTSSSNQMQIGSKLYPDQYESIGPPEKKAGDGGKASQKHLSGVSSSGDTLKEATEDSPTSSPPPPPLPPPISEDDLPDATTAEQQFRNQATNPRQSAVYYNTVLKGDLSDPEKRSSKVHLTSQAAAVGSGTDPKENSTSKNNLQEDLYMNVSVAKS